MNEELNRKLPFLLSAEQSLLSSILIDPNVINDIADTLSYSDFYLEEHEHIYLAMQELFRANREIDAVTLLDLLVQKGVYNQSDGNDYLRTLIEIGANPGNAKDYVQIIKNKSILRQLIDACGEITETAYSEQESVPYMLEYAEKRIFDIAQGRDTKNFQTIREVLLKVNAHLKDLCDHKESSQTTSTGFSALDSVLVGMGKSDLVLVGARPGMGKTSFSMNIATNVATMTKKAVCIFSLEMSAEQLVTRMLSSEALIDSNRLRAGTLNSEDWQKLAQASSTLAGCDILIDDTSNITVTGMKAKLRRVKNEIGLVVIDYLQLMQSDKRTDNRVQEVADISRSLKIMAKELNVPIICCAQLSRNPEARTSKKPMLSDLRDSGAIEQDADIVLFLYNPNYYEEEKNHEASTIEVIVAKNRHGATDTVKMGWIPAYTKFRTIAPDALTPQ